MGYFPDIEKMAYLNMLLPKNFYVVVLRLLFIPSGIIEILTAYVSDNYLSFVFITLIYHLMNSYVMLMFSHYFGEI